MDRDLIRRNEKALVHNRDRKTTDSDEIVKSSTIIVGKWDEFACEQ